MAFRLSSSLIALTSASLLVLAAGCGDDTSDDTSTTQGTSSGGASNSGGSGGSASGGSTSVGGNASGGSGGTGGEGGSMNVQCFPLSVPTVALPDAIPDAFDASSPTWMRPTGEQCPATGLGTEAVPYTTYCYENDTGAAASFLFEIIVDDDTLDPAMVIYDGEAIPADATQCAAVSTELVIDSAEAAYTVPAGGKVTIVPTLQDPGTGTFTVVVGPEF